MNKLEKIWISLFVIFIWLGTWFVCIIDINFYYAITSLIITFFFVDYVIVKEIKPNKEMK